MGHEALKLELIEWLAHLDDDDTISYLKIVKDSCVGSTAKVTEGGLEQKYYHNL